jgi:hypothetical protein
MILGFLYLLYLMAAGESSDKMLFQAFLYFTFYAVGLSVIVFQILVGARFYVSRHASMSLYLSISFVFDLFCLSLSHTHPATEQDRGLVFQSPTLAPAPRQLRPYP